MKQNLKTGWQTIESESVWEQFLDSSNFGTDLLTQSWNWRQCFKNLNQQVICRLYYKKGRPIAGYIAVVEVAKLYKFLTILGGPLFDTSNLDLAQNLATDLKSIAKSHKCDFVRIRPTMPRTDKASKTLKQVGFKAAPIHLSVELTGLLDLSLSDEVLMANMSQSLRRKIRKAQADKLIEIKTSSSDKDLELFVQLHVDHAQFQNFKPFPKARIIEQFKAFKKNNQALIYMAYRQGELLAANMMFFYRSEANYYFGVSTDLGRRHPSAPLLHLEAIKEAKARQIPIYNFWGIVGKDQTKSRYFGFSQFKRSFGIKEYTYIPTHDLAVNKFKYILIYIFETCRRKYRRL